MHDDLKYSFGKIMISRDLTLNQQQDEERVRRYKTISSFLSRYSYLNPKVPEIDQIVPLPPARLPYWDGTFQWLKEHEANVPPPLPTEERLRKMASAKNLDPETGRPLKIKKALIPNTALQRDWQQAARP